MRTNIENTFSDLSRTKKTAQAARRIALELALANGTELDDARLLEAILQPYVGNDEARRHASNLLLRFAHLTDVLHCEMNRLLEVQGLTVCAAAAITRFRQLTRAVTRASIRNLPLFDSPEQVKTYCYSMLCRAVREEFHVLFLDRRGMLLGQECLQRGTIDHVCVYPREVLKRIIELDASTVILVHNHPVGRALPSQADIRMTRELGLLSLAVGANVHDHIIVAPDGVYSFREASTPGWRTDLRDVENRHS